MTEATDLLITTMMMMISDDDGDAGDGGEEEDDDDFEKREEESDNVYKGKQSHMSNNMSMIGATFLLLVMGLQVHTNPLAMCPFSTKTRELLYSYTAKSRDVLGRISPTAERSLEG